jgi:hypothetical protein
MSDRVANMAVQLKLTIEYETLVELAKQLSEEAKRSLIKELDESVTQHELTNEEWKEQFRSLSISRPVQEFYSMRREDWYDEFGR